MAVLAVLLRGQPAPFHPRDVYCFSIATVFPPLQSHNSSSCLPCPALRLQVYPNSTALVVSTENITQNWYFGNDRSMLIPNCLFRLGGAAMVLSNK